MATTTLWWQMAEQVVTLGINTVFLCWGGQGILRALPNWGKAVI